MPMLMVDIRKMLVRMVQWRVLMFVGMYLPAVAPRRAHIAIMRVSMMRIMAMFMCMPHGRMHMRMQVALRQMKPNTDSH